MILPSFKPFVLYVFVLFTALPGALLYGQTFSDGFEQTTISDQWTITGPGSAILTNTLAHTGNQSLQISLSSTSPWQVTVQHDLGQDGTGKAQVWVNAAQMCCSGAAAGFQLVDSSQNSFLLLQQSGNSNCPSCILARASGQNGGPQLAVSYSVLPTSWHLFEIDVASSGSTLSIDGVNLLSVPYVTSVRYLQLIGWGGPGGSANFDDFVFQQGSSYGICPLYDTTKSYKSGSTIPIKLELCDVNGADLSASSIGIHALSVVQTSTQITNPVVDAGNANPDNDFRFDESLGPAGGYIFNLKTTGLSTGTYGLNLSVGLDPSIYTTSFQIR